MSTRKRITRFERLLHLESRKLKDVEVTLAQLAQRISEIRMQLVQMEDEKQSSLHEVGVGTAAARMQLDSWLVHHQQLVDATKQKLLETQNAWNQENQVWKKLKLRIHAWENLIERMKKAVDQKELQRDMALADELATIRSSTRPAISDADSESQSRYGMKR
ncbi:MAG: flagellar FliJ family protein [Pirellulaceae bacterium]